VKTPARAGLHVGVIGEGVCSRRVAALAERVGRAIAEAGAVLLCGGLGGVMEAASRGAARAGGTVVGLLPGFEARDANRWVGIPIVTGMDQARNVILVRSSDAVIAVGGRYGTLSEIALALKLGRPVVGLGTWRLARKAAASPCCVPAHPRRRWRARCAPRGEPAAAAAAGWSSP